jgi:hypothetical protein
MVEKKKSFPLSPFGLEFQAFEILIFYVHQIHPMNMYLHRREHHLKKIKIEINCIVLSIPFDLKKKAQLKQPI